MQYPIDKISSLVQYRDRQIVIVNKPPGMPSSPGQGDEHSALSLMSAYFKTDLHTINRLDRPTSGLLLLARQKKAATALFEAMKNRQIHKHYLAVVSGKMNTETGTVKHHLIADKHRRKGLVVPESDPDSNEAELKYTVLGEIDHYSLLEVELISGRFHQIRAQMAHLGHPIYSDTKYGAKRSDGTGSIGLHAHILKLMHPSKGIDMTFTAKPPENRIWSLFELQIENYGA